MEVYKILVLAVWLCCAMLMVIPKDSSPLLAELNEEENQRWLDVLRNIRSDVATHKKTEEMKKQTQFEQKNSQKIVRAIFTPDMSTQKQYKKAGLSLVGFSYVDCSGAGASAHVTALRVAPDPIPLPGNVTVAAQGVIAAPVTGNLTAAVTLEVDVFGFYVRIPCDEEKKIGSCTYTNLCPLLPPPHQPCPPPLQKAGIPCRCPFKPGKYSLPPTTFEIPSVPVPIRSEKFRVTVHVTSGGKPVTCLQIEAAYQKTN